MSRSKSQFPLPSSHSRKRKLKQQEIIQIALPEDIALKIASYLQVPDVCALGSCSRFWRELCRSDFLWESLARERWPLLLGSSGESSSSAGATKRAELVELKRPAIKGWKGFYIKCHHEMAERAASVAQYVEQCSSSDSLEISDYLNAIEDLNSKKLSFKDIAMYLFKPKATVLLNLVGLHYCLDWLGVPAENVMEALKNYNISQRQVCVRWWKLGTWFNDVRMRDEFHARQISLQDLAVAKENAVLGVLYRGAIHEVQRVRISVATPASTSWSTQVFM